MSLEQGPSWSGRDYGGHWKLLMYAVRRFFSPVLVSGVYNATQADALSVYITNDQPWSVEGEVHTGWSSSDCGKCLQQIFLAEIDMCALCSQMQMIQIQCLLIFNSFDRIISYYLARERSAVFNWPYISHQTIQYMLKAVRTW